MATHGELMDLAVAETGLDDFGDDSFREGLEILVPRSVRRPASMRPARASSTRGSRGTWASGCRWRTGTGVTRRSATSASMHRSSV